MAAFDLTFSAPKSVSVLFAIADERTSAALLDAHRHAVAAAFAYVEREACFTRRGRNGVDRVRGMGSWRRRTAIGSRGRGIRSCTPTSWWRT